jgi:hypothetical protein
MFSQVFFSFHSAPYIADAFSCDSKRFFTCDCGKRIRARTVDRRNAILRIMDLAGFDKALDWPGGTRVVGLRQILREKFQHDLSHSRFYRKGEEFLPGNPSSRQFSDSNVIVLFN